MFKVYPLQILLTAVGVGNTGNGVNKVLKITDGRFRWKRLAYAAYDAAGVLVPNPNVTLACKQGSFNIFSDATALASLQRGDQPTFELPDQLDLAKGDEINFIATGQSGSQVTVLNLTMIGDEAK